jgi:hypothetical protein
MGRLAAFLYGLIAYGIFLLTFTLCHRVRG